MCTKFSVHNFIAQAVFLLECGHTDRHSKSDVFVDFHNRVTLTFDHWLRACRATAIEYTCSKFGVDSSSHFPVRARTTDKQTDRQTDATECPTHAGGYAGVGNNMCVNNKQTTKLTVFNLADINTLFQFYHISLLTSVNHQSVLISNHCMQTNHIMQFVNAYLYHDITW